MNAIYGVASEFTSFEELNEAVLKYSNERPAQLSQIFSCRLEPDDVVQYKQVVKNLLTPESFQLQDTKLAREVKKNTKETTFSESNSQGYQPDGSSDNLKKTSKLNARTTSLEQDIINLSQKTNIHDDGVNRQHPQQFATPLHPGHAYHSGAHPGSCHGPSNPDNSLIHLKHTTEVIGRQAADITELKTTAKLLEDKYNRDVALLRERLEETSTRHREDIKRWKDEVDHQTLLHQRQMKEKEDIHHKECSLMRDKIQEMAIQLEEERKTHRTILEEMKVRLRDADEEKLKLETNYDNNLREQRDALMIANRELEQMRVYIQVSQQSAQTLSEWEKERQDTCAKIKDLEDAVESLKATEEYLNIRLFATQNIISLQEAELLKSQADIESPSETGISILTKYREKIYAMLIQQKSQQLVTAKEQTNHRLKINEFQEQLEKKHSMVQRLEHSLSDRDAELNMEKQTNKARSEELQSTKAETGRLSEQLVTWEDTGINIKRMLINYQESFAERVSEVHGALQKFAAAEQRIKFATSRVNLLKDLFACKESSMRVIGTSSSRVCRNVECQTDELIIEDYLPWKELQTELDHVCQERDTLASELRGLSKQMEKRVSEAVQSLKEEIDILTAKTSQLEIDLHQKSKVCGNLTEELDQRNHEMQDMIETNASLRINLSKLEASAETASDAKCADLEEKYKMQLLEMEKRLNESRREHAKAVISYRQMERQLNREKEKAKDTLEDKESYLKSEIDHLRKKLQETEKDKNLLMATLKQEGLISKYKSNRRTAIDHREDDKDEEDGTNEERREEDKNSLDLKLQTNDLSAMMKDVQSLAVQVLGNEFGEVT